MRPSDQTLLALLTNDICHELSQWLKAQQSLGATDVPLWQAYQSPVTPKAKTKADKDRQKTEAQTSRFENLPDAVQKQTVTPSQAPNPFHSKESKTNKATISTNPLAAYKALRGEDKTEKIAKNPEEKRKLLLQLETRVMACRQCELGSQRRGVIFAFGPEDASIASVFVGANPLEFDQKKILTGKAAELFERIILAMAKLEPEAQKERLYMTNLIKCAATPSRKNASKCAKECLEHLRRQLCLLQPKVIIVWGQLAYQSLFGEKYTLAQARGQKRFFEGIPTIPTHHPMEMVKNPNLHKRVWDDLKRALEEIKN